jgi:RNA polymerase sigma factor (sigma-70 family)
MRDGGMVAGIVAGDPTALTAAYDHYAPALYVYSRSLLSEPADAADAVLDTFVVAALRLPGLRDPSRLRPWLYAVARNECHRRRHAGAPEPSTAETPEAPEPVADPAAGDSTADLSAALEQAELRELTWSALSGLEPGDREIVELSMRHEFYGADLADVLGLPRNQAHALGSRARQRFDTAVSTLAAARTGYGSCPALAEILGSWEGKLTPSMRREVRQHITECGACGAERRRAVSPPAMLALLPVPALPEDLRYQVLGVITDGSADAVRYCGAVAERAEPFVRSGFPAPLDPLASVRGPTTFIPAVGVLIAVFAVFGGGAMLATNTLHHSSTAGSALAPATVPSASAQPAPAASVPPAAQGQSGHQNGPQVTPVGVLNPSASLPTPAQKSPKSSSPTSGSGGSSQPGAPKASQKPAKPPSPGQDPSPAPTKTTQTSNPPTTPPPTTPPPTTPPPTTPPPTTPPPTTPPPTSPAPSTSGSGTSTSGSGTSLAATSPG